MFTTKTCQVRASSGIHHQLSCNLSAVLLLNDDGKQLFCQRKNLLFILAFFSVSNFDFIGGRIRLTYLMFFETRLYTTHLVNMLGRYCRKRCHDSWAWGVYTFQQYQTELLTHLSCPDTIKHVSYLWPDICRVLNESFTEWRSQIQVMSDESRKLRWSGVVTHISSL